MHVLVGSSLFSFIGALTGAEEALVSTGKDDTHCSSHVDNISVRVVETVLSGVLTSVSIDVFELIPSLGRTRVSFGVVGGLNDGPFIRSHTHELFS